MPSSQICTQLLLTTVPRMQNTARSGAAARGGLESGSPMGISVLRPCPALVRGSPKPWDHPEEAQENQLISEPSPHTGQLINGGGSFISIPPPHAGLHSGPYKVFPPHDLLCLPRKQRHGGSCLPLQEQMSTPEGQGPRCSGEGPLL